MMLHISSRWLAHVLCSRTVTVFMVTVFMVTVFMVTVSHGYGLMVAVSQGWLRSLMVKVLWLRSHGYILGKSKRMLLLHRCHLNDAAHLIYIVGSCIVC